ncbi:GAD-like domain-containing protein [Caballeronia sp. NK8]|uniref:GAD-like domain-containing protein n=1 Tax=Caballeronia sp. NK8 TaxID=140098 RepID=UPI001CEDDB0B|nr:GAD-like domain-containing protein [Caballeronia sp. NK8]
MEEFGEAAHRVEVPDRAIGKWRGKLPERLLSFWKDEGWSGYSDGLFWTVDPDDYEDLVDEWLDGTPLEQVDAFHAIARTAFGELFLFGESTGRSLKIAPLVNSIFIRNLTRKKPDQLDLSLRAFFGLDKATCDLQDESGKPLFARALSRLGAVEPDEMYAFEPALIAGGKMVIDGLAKVKLDQHLTILRQLSPPTFPFCKDLNELISKL